MYRPLVLLSYAFDYAVGEYGGLGYHLTNLAIHLAVTGLLYLVLKNLGATAGAAAAGALLFGVHPLTTEPVNYISSRSESMAVMFCVASFLLYLRTGRHRSIAVLSVAGFAAALLSKSVAIGFPLV
ncbi:hypothetical protein ACFL6X_01910, partial [Candidatus Latescibacterota bacterium]